MGRFPIDFSRGQRQVLSYARAKNPTRHRTRDAYREIPGGRGGRKKFPEEKEGSLSRFLYWCSLVEPDGDGFI